MQTASPRAPHAPRTSVILRLLFAKLEHVGSSSPEFWSAFDVVLPQLSDEELLRVALACGERGRTVFRAVATPRAFGPRAGL